MFFETYGYDEQLYADYALESQGPGGVEYLPFTGAPRLPNLDFEATLDTPQFSKFSGTFYCIWGKDENFYEWASADIIFARCRATGGPPSESASTAASSFSSTGAAPTAPSSAGAASPGRRSSIR